MQAIWFTQNPGVEGQVFGNTEVWRGLGVMLDSFDNDGLVSMEMQAMYMYSLIKGRGLNMAISYSLA